jgi:2,3-dihydroxybenzoate-AMP ligase
VLGTLRAGGRVVLSPTPGPTDAFPLIAAERVSVTTLMPSILGAWIEATEFIPADLSGVLFQVGGAWLDPNVADAVVSRLRARLTHWFGMAEGFLCHTRLDDPQEVVRHSCGRPLCPADEVRVVAADGADVGGLEVGELLVRGPYTLRGYYCAEDYNRLAFTPDGFLRTGDLVRRTVRGDLVVEGRIKDIVNRGGEKVPAEEVEQRLVAHPAVLQAAIVPIPDLGMVEKTCAFVVAHRPHPTLSQLREFLRAAGLAEYKFPDQVEFVETLPYTNLGKVDKRALRERASAVDRQARTS